MNRRNFLINGSLSTAAIFSAIHLPAASQEKKIKVGVIGVGWYGMVITEAAFKAGGIEVLAKSIDFLLEHMHKVFPELYLDLFCYGPVEKGLDATNGGVEFYNICVDASSLATAADSFAAIEQRVEKDSTFRPLRSELAAIDVSNFGNRKSKKLPGIVMYAKDGTEIYWGAFDGNLEAVWAEKFGKLYQYYTDYGSLNAKTNGDARYIDLRLPERIVPVP